MRIRTIGQCFAVVVAVVLSSCDTRTPTGGTGGTGGAANSHVQIAIPKFLGGRDNLASQVSGSTDDNGPHITTARVRISVVAESRNLLDRNFDVSTLCNSGDSGDSQTACTLVVDFPIDNVADGATLQFQVDALDASGVIQYQIGPTTFTLNSNHSGGSVQSTARYVGVGSDATGVAISPRSLSLTVGAAAGTLSCAATGGTATTAQRASIPLAVTSSSPSVATVRFTTAGIEVTPVAAGSTQVSCQLDFGSHASDAVTVTVAGAGGGTGAISLTVRNGSSQSPVVGATVEVRAGANNITGPGPLTQVTPANGLVSFSSLAAGPYTIRVAASGFVDNLQNVAVFAGQTFQATAAMQTSGVAIIQGTVRNGTSPINNATVSLRAGTATSGTTLQQFVTVSPGTYVFSGLAAGTYTVSATASGFAQNDHTLTIGSSGTTTQDFSMSTGSTTGGIAGIVTSSTDGNPIAGSAVELRAGTNVITGSVLASQIPATTGPQAGAYAFTNLAPGPYTVRATAPTYSDLPINVTVVAGQTATANASLSRCAVGSVCIVLQWGAQPQDLDGHLLIPGGNEIYYNNLGSCVTSPFACQDFDVTSGNGPETIRLTQVSAGTYTYKVHDYTDWGFNDAGAGLAQSGARVDVYFGPILQRTFNVPNQPGIIWTVFTLSGTTITPSTVPIGTTYNGVGIRAGIQAEMQKGTKPPPKPR